MKKKFKPINLFLILNLICFFAIYVIPTGFTNANDIFDVNESGLFSLCSLYSWTVIGLLLMISFVTIWLQRNSNLYVRNIITITLMGVQIAIIWILPGFDVKTYGIVTLYNELIDELTIWGELSSVRMLQLVLLLFIISTIVACLIILAAVIDIIHKSIKNEGIVTDCNERHMYDGYGKFFNIFMILVLSVYTLVVTLITTINTPVMLGIFENGNPMFCIAVLISCVLPLILFYFLMCKEWVRKRKWLKVSLAFVVVCIMMYFGTGRLLVISMISFFAGSISTLGIILPILGVVYLLIQFPIIVIISFVFWVISKIKKSSTIRGVV